MTPIPEDPHLAAIAEELIRARGASLITDRDMNLVWVSDELRDLMGSATDEDLCLGKNIIEAYMSGVWSSKITLESQMKIMVEDFPKVMYMMPGGKDELKRIFRRSLTKWCYTDQLIPDPQTLDSVVEQLFLDIEPQKPPPFYTSVFEYVQGDLPPAKIVEYCITLSDLDGELIGGVVMYNPALPATVLSLVARGDEAMYGRMTRLADPGRHKAAVLFADLQASAALSRKLPSAAYFKLIRSITTAIDDVVARHQGIVGKHAGDGASAFFLVDDVEGEDSAAVRAAIEAAREITVAAANAAKAVGDETGLVESADTVVNVGVHWGGALFMGQLVTGGRLEVTALGDNVNECARIQESARDGEVLGSKTLIEHLDANDAAALGIDPDGVVYRAVSELPGATDKAKADAGSIPVTVLNTNGTRSPE